MATSQKIPHLEPNSVKFFDYQGENVFCNDSGYGLGSVGAEEKHVSTCVEVVRLNLTGFVLKTIGV